MKASIIVASKNSERTIRQNLQAILQQTESFDEIIVVDASCDESAEIVAREFPAVKLLRLPPDVLIPQLWSTGLKEADGEIVAITTAHFVPSSQWLSCVKASLTDGITAAGGAIQQAPGGSLVDYAVYYCRYVRYMPPFQRRSTTDLPGDNVAYTRALYRYQNLFEDGFWEPFIHARMEQDGLRLYLVPEMLVFHHHSFDFLSFLKNRLVHGRHFGRDRAATFHGAKRYFYFLASPLTPLIQIKRIIGELLRKKQLDHKFFLASPILFLFLCAWTIGEALGYLQRSQRS